MKVFELVWLVHILPTLAEMHRMLDAEDVLSSGIRWRPANIWSGAANRQVAEYQWTCGTVLYSHTRNPDFLVMWIIFVLCSLKTNGLHNATFGRGLKVLPFELWKGCIRETFLKVQSSYEV